MFALAFTLDSLPERNSIREESFILPYGGSGCAGPELHGRRHMWQRKVVYLMQRGSRDGENAGWDPKYKPPVASFS